MDGVIADTTEYHYQSWQRLADEEGISFNREENEAIRGLTRRASLDHVLKGRVIDEDTALSWMNRKNQYFHENMAQIQPGDELPGINRLLHEIRAAGLKMAVGSSSSNARRVLEHLELLDHFDIVGGGNIVVNSKPAPDIFLWVAGAIQLMPAEILVIEDAVAGIQAARNGGFHVVGVGDSPGIEQADHTFSSLADVSVDDLLTLFDARQKT